jgi:excisionase family DNA binding protein
VHCKILMDSAAAAEDVRRASKRCRRLNRKTIYAYVQRGLIPHVRIESNVRFSEHQVMRWLEERSFQPRLVRGKGAKRQ